MEQRKRRGNKVTRHFRQKISKNAPGSFHALSFWLQLSLTLFYTQDLVLWWMEFPRHSFFCLRQESCLRHGSGCVLRLGFRTLRRGSPETLRLGRLGPARSAVMADGYGEWSVQMAVVIPCYTMLYHVIPCYTSPLDMGNYM